MRGPWRPGCRRAFGGFAEAFGDIFGDMFGQVVGGGRGGRQVYRAATCYAMEVTLEEAAKARMRRSAFPPGTAATPAMAPAPSQHQAH